MNSQKKFQPSKSTIVEVKAGLAKTKIETTRIAMQDGNTLESSHELPKKISAIKVNHCGSYCLFSKDSNDNNRQQGQQG